MSQSIVLTICQQHGVKPEQFFGRQRGGKVVACRHAAIVALLEAGFSKRGCSRLMRRNYSTIMYWLHADYREHRKARMRANRRRYARHANHDVAKISRTACQITASA